MDQLHLDEVAAYLGDSTPKFSQDEREAGMRARLIDKQMRRKW